ncbi:MAG TPA: hypothetical protein PLU30_25035 [Verrucomicrobiae bacterium]|nr:hypothetical protein [Verrucomicrobiae bacterium]
MSTTRDATVRVQIPTPATLLLSMNQAARMLGVGKDQVRCWMDAGQLQTVVPPGGTKRKILTVSLLNLAGIEAVAPPMRSVARRRDLREAADQIRDTRGR